MAEYSEMILGAEDQALAAVRQVQEVAMNAVATISETAGSMLPEVPAVPFAERIPTLHDVVETTFASIERLVAAQKDYWFALIEAVSPVTSKFEPAKPHKPARKSTAKTSK